MPFKPIAVEISKPPAVVNVGNVEELKKKGVNLWGWCVMLPPDDLKQTLWDRVHDLICACGGNPDLIYSQLQAQLAYADAEHALENLVYDSRLA